MTPFTRRTLFWAPRALSIAFIAFLSMFALDVFGAGYGFWQTLLALFMHLIPTFVLIAALVLAWRWEWIGAALYAGAGLLYVVWVLGHRLAPHIKFLWIITIALPAFIIAGLFLAGWLKRGELRVRS